MAKPTIKQSEASTKLLDINTELHKLMADMIVAKTKEEGVATLPVDLVKQAVLAGGTAAIVLKDASPQAAELPNIMKLADTISKAIEAITEKGGQFFLPADAADLLTDKIMNVLANQVHDAAMSLIGATGHLQGCTVAELIPDEAKDVSTYCTGVLNSISKAVVHKGSKKKETVGGKEIITHLPQIVTHTLGLHKVDVSIHDMDGSDEVAIDYHESGPGYADSKNRMKGVQQRMEKEGLECLPKYPSLFCHGEIAKPKLAQLAAFFSLLLDGDIHGVGPEKPSVISEKVWDIAGNLYQKYGTNTWQSSQYKLDWSGLYKQWMAEKDIYLKGTIYTDLRQVALFHDKHHQLEAKYGIETGNISQTGAQQVVDNGKAALEILHKNKWPEHGLSMSVSHLESAIKAGNLHGLLGMSDAIGHVMHMALVSVLEKEGAYGGCDTKADIANIYGGNLVYCEGVLKGTSGTFSGKSGNQISHKVAPNTYTNFIMGDNPDGSYDVTITLPQDAKWRKKAMAFLHEHKHFICPYPGNTCKANIKDLDSIRELALFFSNLKGASEAIGDECGDKAIEMADTNATTQNKKGVFAFTQNPVMDNAKAWIDTCHKQFGILPPGLTKEEKEILTLIGPSKTYGGCNFGETETIPNKGILTYCEGVRKNPLTDISAHMIEGGKLYHFFHGTTDKLADVNIIPLADNKYQVELSEIDLRRADLQEAALATLNNPALKCTGNSCTGELNANELRTVAAFLSSFHHAYKDSIGADCIPKIVSHVALTVGKLPNSPEAHDSVVHPWTETQWNKEVCGKVAPEAKPAEAVAPGFQWKVPLEKFEYAGGPWVIPKAHIVELVNQGTSKDKLIEALIDPSTWPAGVGALPSEIAKAVADLYMPVEKAAPEVPPEKVWKGGPTPTPPFKVAGCTSLTKQTPTAVKIKYCAGVVGKTKVADTVNILHLPGHLPGTAALLTPTENTHSVAGGKVVFTSKWNTLYITLPKELLKIDPVIKKLKGAPFYMDSDDDKTFHMVFGQYGPRAIARFLSYLGDIHYVPEWCWQAAVDYAAKKATSSSLFTDYIYPYAAYDWMNEVCMLIPGAPVTKVPTPMTNYADLTPAEKESVIKDMKFLIKSSPSLMITHIKDIRTKYNLELAGLHELWDKLKAEVKAEVEVEKAVKAVTEFTPDQLKATILDILHVADNNKSEYETIFKAIQAYHPTIQAGPAGQVGTVTWAIDELLKEKKIAYFGGTTYGLSEAPTEKPTLSGLIVEQTQLILQLYDKITAVDMVKAGVTTEYKKLPKPVKDWLHAIMNKRLLEGQKSKVPYEQTVKKLQEDIIHPPSAIEKIPITPLMVKLQTDLEKKRKIRKGELPAEPGEKVAKKYEELSQEEQNEVNDEISNLIEGGADVDTTIDQVMKTFGLEDSVTLNDQVVHETEEYAGKEAPLDFSDLSSEAEEQADKDIIAMVSAGEVEENIANAISAKYHVKWDDPTLHNVIKLTIAAKEEQQVKMQYYSDLSEAKQKQVVDDINKAAGFGTTKEELIQYLHEGYGIFTDTPLDKMIDEIYGKPKMKHISDLTPKELDLAQDFIYGKMMAGISIPVIKAELADQFPGGIIHNADYEIWVDQIVDKLQEAHPGLIEKGLTFSDLGKISKDYMNSYIKARASIPFTQVYNDVSLQFNVKKSKLFNDWAYNVWLDAHEDLISWDELTPEEQQKFAAKVAESGIAGWDELKAMATESGIYPNPDEIPSILELKDMVKAKPPDEMEDFILGFLSSQPGVKFNATDIDYALNKAGHETKGIIPTGDLLVKMGKEGKINWKALLPYAFWISKKAKPQPPLSEVMDALKLIADGKPYAGCYPDKLGIVLSPIQTVYCQGILTPPKKKKAGYVSVTQGPDSTVIPTVSQYGDGYNAIVTAPSADRLTIAFKEMEKKGPQWKKRQDAVAELMAKELEYACAFQDDHFICAKSPLESGKKEDRDLVRTTAIFLSKLHGVDELDRACIDEAVRYAYTGAKSLNQDIVEQELAFKHPVYPYTVEEWNIEVCAKLVSKPQEEKAKIMAKEYSTAQLLEAAHKLGVDPSGSEVTLLKHLLEAGWDGKV